MGIIDIHTHAFSDKLAPRAIAALEAECPWKAVSGGTVGELVASMDEADIDVSALCCIATKPDQTKAIFRWCRKIRSDRIEPFPSVHPDTPDAGDWVHRFCEADFAGIKLHPMYQEFAIDEPRLHPIYAAAAEAGIVVTFHVGYDIAFPPDDDRAAPERLRRVLDTFPDLHAICTHLGGWQDWQASGEHIIGTNTYIETSFSLGPGGCENAVELIRQHGVERVLFGTDWPWRGQRQDLEFFDKLNLSDDERSAILYRNAGKLLGY